MTTPSAVWPIGVDVGKADIHDYMARSNLPSSIHAISSKITIPPSNPAEGDLYIIPASASGAWSGYSGKLAQWSGGAWMVITPENGTVATLDGQLAALRFSNASWVPVPTPERIFTGQITIADDAVGSLVTPAHGGFILIGFTGTAYPSVNRAGLFSYDVGASLYLFTLFESYFDNLQTSSLGGATGSDGRFSIGVRDGHIDIENRNGYAAALGYTFLG